MKKLPRTMTDSQFFERLAIEGNFSGVEVGKSVYSGLLRLMKSELVSQGRIYLPLLGTFKISQRKARRTRDAHTGRPIVIQAYKAVVFKSSNRVYKYFRDK